jgi:hypothetical protein
MAGSTRTVAGTQPSDSAADALAPEPNRATSDGQLDGTAAVAESGGTGGAAATSRQRLKFPIALTILAIMVILAWVVGRRRGMGSPASAESTAT